MVLTGIMLAFFTKSAFCGSVTMIKVAISGSEHDIGMEPDIYDAMMGLRQFLFDNVYLNKNAEVATEEDKAKNIIEGCANKEELIQFIAEILLMYDALRFKDSPIALELKDKMEG